MLKIKNLTKIYRTKGGAETLALDNVSVSFDKTGLVFLLGKSGSGKSTLLNLAGGLDEPTSGEIVIMGKSSKDFTGSDFDSYRNTYVGFVFQEYNILNEFNVEDNVALALELQGKTKEREKVKRILEEVELASYAKRKPNTLSGGQKQRIAIARALVKDPQIIMADEPTGALDSATGKQVFETLKHLSKTRLVLVVSHDRASAEEYGDRIVELKDGKIISDVTKTRESAEPVSSKVKRIGKNLLSVQSGDPDEETLRTVCEFLREGEGEVLLSKGEEENKNFKRANRIDESGARERFVETDEKSIPESSESPKFIKSRLPARKAIRIGASGLKLKPVRLAFTILLSFVSFVMFGLFSTMMLYDGNEVLAESFLKSDYEYLLLSKQYEARYTYGGGYTSVSRDQTQFTPKEVSSFGENAVGAYRYDVTPENLQMHRDNRTYYQPELHLVSSLPANHPLRKKLVAGSYPTGENEICVSSYFAECARNGTFTSCDEKGEEKGEKKIESASSLVGEYLVVRGGVFKISGVFDCGEIPHKYEKLKTEEDFLLEYTYMSFLEEGLFELVLVDDPFFEAHPLESGKENFIEYFDAMDDYYSFISPYNEENDFYGTSAMRVYEENPTKEQLSVLRFDGETSALEEKEIIVAPVFLIGYLSEQYSIKREELQKEMPQESDFEDDESFQKAMEEFEGKLKQLDKENVAVQQALQGLIGWEYYVEETDEWIPVKGKEDVEKLVKIIEGAVKEPFEVSAMHYENRGDDASVGTETTFKVVGLFYSEEEKFYNLANGMYCSQAFYDASEKVQMDVQIETKYVHDPDEKFTCVLVPFTKTRDGILNFVARTGTVDPETDVLYRLDNRLYTDVDTVNELVDVLSVVFLAVGLVFMIFSALLLFSFISMSISNKKREIGILRAVGARGTDVFKIFFSESGIIVGICTILAIVGSMILTTVLNSILKAEVGFDVTLFVFGPMPMLLMVAVAAVVAVISTFLPVYFAAKKKPVESIRAL